MSDVVDVRCGGCLVWWMSGVVDVWCGGCLCGGCRTIYILHACVTQPECLKGAKEEVKQA